MSIYDIMSIFYYVSQFVRRNSNRSIFLYRTAGTCNGVIFAMVPVNQADIKCDRVDDIYTDKLFGLQ